MKVGSICNIFLVSVPGNLQPHAPQIYWIKIIPSSGHLCEKMKMKTIIQVTLQPHYFSIEVFKKVEHFRFLPWAWEFELAEESYSGRISKSELNSYQSLFHNPNEVYAEYTRLTITSSFPWSISFLTVYWNLTSFAGSHEGYCCANQPHCLWCDGTFKVAANIRKYYNIFKTKQKKEDDNHVHSSHTETILSSAINTVDAKSLIFFSSLMGRISVLTQYLAYLHMMRTDSRNF